MKLIVATIHTDKWRAVQDALRGPDAHILYISAVGDLRETLVGNYRGASFSEPRPRTRLEIVVANDLAVPDVLDALKFAACDPNLQKITSGSIFVLPLEEWITIPEERPGPVAAHEVFAGAREAS